jgi:hypothetical protein
MADTYSSHTTYNYAFNDPVFFNDPNGADPNSDGWNQIQESRNYDMERNYYNTHGIYGDDDMYGMMFGKIGVGPNWEWHNAMSGEINAERWVREYLGVSDVKAGYTYSSEIITSWAGMPNYWNGDEDTGNIYEINTNIWTGSSTHTTLRSVVNPIVANAPSGLDTYIPIWGAGKQAAYWYGEGDFSRGLLYTAVAVSDVFMVKAALTAVARGSITVAGRYVTNQAVKNPILTTREAAAALRNPRLNPMMQGKGIDRAFREAAKNNLILSPAQKIGLLKINPTNRGADMVGKGLINGTWWDVTTAGSWQSHVAKYGEGGIQLLYKLVK